MKSSSVKAIIYLGVQLNFCQCFLYLLSIWVKFLVRNLTIILGAVVFCVQIGAEWAKLFFWAQVNLS